MTLNDILKDAILKLENSKIDNPKFDATEILLEILDIDMANFLLKKETDLENLYDKRFIIDLINKYDQLIEYRAEHFPLQYILGETYFMGLNFRVDENVLIPRYDTEILVEKVLTDNNDKNKYVLDLCTGSGCIAISLAKLGDYKLIVGSDISHDAIEIASDNANRLIENNDTDMEMKQKIYFLESDMFSEFDRIKNNIGIEKFDIIVSNPPYIKTSVINELDIEVSKYEPFIALDGDEDGLKFYRIISKEGKKYLSENGLIYVEIGIGQVDDVKKIFERDGYNIKEIVKDMSGIDRVIVLS